MRRRIHQDSFTDFIAYSMCMRGKDETIEEREKMQFLVLGMKNITGKTDIFKHTSNKMVGTRNVRRIQRDVSLGHPYTTKIKHPHFPLS